MKKLYTSGEDKVHPSPPPVADHLSLLPATLLALTAVLPLQDKQVLAYLISCCNSKSKNLHHGQQEHDYDDDGPSPRFECSCFRCYMCFWSVWDKSPNREVIHEIIEAYEEGLLSSSSSREKEQVVKKKKKKGRRKRVNDGFEKDGFVKMNCSTTGDGDGETEWGSIRKIVSFIGDSIWGVLNF